MKSRERREEIEKGGMRRGKERVMRREAREGGKVKGGLSMKDERNNCAIQRDETLINCIELFG